MSTSSPPLTCQKPTFSPTGRETCSFLQSLQSQFPRRSILVPPSYGNSVVAPAQITSCIAKVIESLNMSLGGVQSNQFRSPWAKWPSNDLTTVSNRYGADISVRGTVLATSNEYEDPTE